MSETFQLAERLWTICLGKHWQKDEEVQQRLVDVVLGLISSFPPQIRTRIVKKLRQHGVAPALSTRPSSVTSRDLGSERTSAGGEHLAESESELASPSDDPELASPEQPPEPEVSTVQDILRYRDRWIESPAQFFGQTPLNVVQYLLSTPQKPDVRKRIAFRLITGELHLCRSTWGKRAKEFIEALVKSVPKTDGLSHDQATERINNQYDRWMRHGTTSNRILKDCPLGTITALPENINNSRYEKVPADKENSEVLKKFLHDIGGQETASLAMKCEYLERALSEHIRETCIPLRRVEDSEAGTSMTSMINTWPAPARKRCASDQQDSGRRPAAPFSGESPSTINSSVFSQQAGHGDPVQNSDIGFGGNQHRAEPFLNLNPDLVPQDTFNEIAQTAPSCEPEQHLPDQWQRCTGVPISAYTVAQPGESGAHPMSAHWQDMVSQYECGTGQLQQQPLQQALNSWTHAPEHRADTDDPLGGTDLPCANFGVPNGVILNTGFAVSQHSSLGSNESIYVRESMAVVGSLVLALLSLVRA
ncbi:hypothetical protein CSUB01_06041 [Colletotrichum sublineola]|uniref:Uncharacterized protein n=1 Tax=Colletotrichum sublineola TaxID=1173701 RepID=A0A066X402_COLSU|nr:hypothetical protein CSUB01_06041 [Colletotrichum sublineola]